MQNRNIPRIALVADEANWAFANISREIVCRIGETYDFQIFYYADYQKPEILFAKLFQGKFDCVHFFSHQWVAALYLYLRRRAASASAAWLRPYLATRITCSVYDHGDLDPGAVDRNRVIYDFVNAYSVSSEKLRTIYGGLAGYRAPECVIEDGVDTGRFFPVNTERLADTSRELVIGWVGNSRWHHYEGIDHKGFFTLIRPALEELQAEGVRVVGRFADRNAGFIPYDQMVQYYNSIDVYVCASDNEGTPNPVMEAMACGVPVVSTDVGIVPQLFGVLQQSLILPVRSVAALKEKIRALALQPEKRAALSQENILRIADWTRAAESRKWDRFFSSVLARPSDETERRQALLQLPLPESSLQYMLRRMREIVVRRYNILLFACKYRP